MLRKGILDIGAGASAGARRTRITSSNSNLRSTIKSSYNSLSTTKRQLYDLNNSYMVNNDIPFITHPIVPYTRLASEGRLKPVLPEPFKGLESKLNFNHTIEEAPITHTIHLSLLNQLKKFSDPHAKLTILLNYYETVRLLNPEILDTFLKENFNVESSSESYCKLSDDLLIKLSKVYAMLREDTKISEIYQYVATKEEPMNKKLIKNLNNTVFSLLKNDCDLELTFIDILKNIYVNNGIEIKALKDFYLLMSTDETLKSNLLNTTSFLDILKTVQLSTVIEKTDNVLVLPKQYWETKYHYVNVLLVMKLLKQNEIKLAFDHIEKANLYDVEGLSYRLLKNSKHLVPPSSKMFSGIEQLSTIETTLISYFSKTTLPYFSKALILVWSTFTRNIAFQYNVITALRESNHCLNLNDFKASLFNQMVLTDSYKISWLYVERNSIKYGNEVTSLFNIPLLVRLVLKTNNKRKYTNLIKNILTPTQKNQFIEIAIVKVLQNAYSDIGNIPRKIQWLLEAYEYDITASAFLKLTPLFKKHLSIDQSVEFLKNFKNVPFFFSLKFLKHLPAEKRVDLLSNLMSENIITISDSIASYIAQNFKIDEQIQLLERLKSHPYYQKLHIELTKHLLSTGRSNEAELLLSENPPQQSKTLIEANELLIHPGLLPNTSDDSLKMQVFKELLTPGEVTITNPFKKRLNKLMRNKDVDKKALSLLILKNVSTHLRKCSVDNKIFFTKRLDWAIALCNKHQVDPSLMKQALN